MSKIYIVTEGSYSDYSILTVFSTKEKADAFLSLYNKNKWNEAEIEEYEIDEPDNRFWRYEVEIEKDGNVIRAHPFLVETSDILFREYEYPRKRIVLIVDITTEDRETAVKTANEIRTQLIALNIWGDNDKLKELYTKKEVSNEVSK